MNMCRLCTIVLYVDGGRKNDVKKYTHATTSTGYPGTYFRTPCIHEYTTMVHLFHVHNATCSACGIIRTKNVRIYRSI